MLVLHAADLAEPSEEEYLFSCGDVFGPKTTFESLAAEFGVENLKNTEIHFHEGFYESGTLLFPDTHNEVEIFWHDPETRQSLRSARILGDHSSWVTPQGLRLGLDLRAIEAINRFPFRLAGFGWDYGGTVLSWGSGDLHAMSNPTCRTLVRFGEGDPERGRNIQLKHGIVSGDREFSSGHQTMQLLNPTVKDLTLVIH